MTDVNYTRSRRRNMKRNRFGKKGRTNFNHDSKKTDSVAVLSDPKVPVVSKNKMKIAHNLDMNLKVRANLISKKFELSQNEKLREFLGIGKKNREIKEFWALRNVSFEVYDGEAIGIVGLNGSGKSTLLNIVDKSLGSSAGELEINGEVSQIAIGAGLKDGLTGRDNIRLKGTMMGLSKQEIEDRMDDIIQFSELGPFIDRQVKDYSSGMRSKLAFSIAINHDPDILIIDEALSVGDSTFAAKSAKKMFEFRERGKTIFVVSHNVNQIKKWTDKVVWLHYGEVKEYGKTEDVLPKYQAFIHWFNALPKEQQDQYKLDRRQEQLDFSVDALKQEVIDNSSIEAGEASVALIDETIKKNKQKSNMSLASKMLMGACLLFMMIGLVVTAKGTSLSKIGILQTKIDKSTKLTTPSKNQSDHKKSNTSSSSTNKNSSDDKGNTINYTIQPGDTISEIATTHNISTDKILELNPGIDSSVISVGMVIKLPKSATPQSTTASTSELFDTSSDPVTQSNEDEELKPSSEQQNTDTNNETQSSE